MIKEQTILKKDTTENWNKAKNFIPKEGEFIYYSDINNYKIGDGETRLQDLSFIRNYKYTFDNGTLIIEGG